MDLSEFIKVDIVNFLDELALDPNNLSITPEQSKYNLLQSRTSIKVNNQDLSSFDALPEDQVGTYILSKDYETEFSKAMSRGNLFKAKKLLKELKEKFSEYPDNSPEKREVKTLIKDLYSKFKDYINGDAILTKEFSSIDLEETNPFNQVQNTSNTPNIQNIQNTQNTLSTQNTQNAQSTWNNLETTGDWDDLPVPSSSNSVSSSVQISKTPKQTIIPKKTTLKLKSEPELRPESKPKLERPPKDVKKLYEEEQALKKKRVEELAKKQAEEEALRKAEAAEKTIHSKIKLLHQLIQEGQLFEATSKYKEIKNSQKMFDVRPERRQAILDSIKHLYSDLRIKLERHYEQRLSHDKTKYVSDYSYLEGEVHRLVVAGKQKGAIIKYKELLSFIKKHPELEEEKIRLKKLYLSMKQLFEKQKRFDDQKKLSVKKNLEEKEKELILRKKLLQQKTYNPTEHILSKEIKKLKGRP